jgi:hypothetical protein
MRRAFRIAAVLAVGSLAVAACGGGDDDAGAGDDAIEADTDEATDDATGDDAATGDDGGAGDDGDSSAAAAVGFGELASGTIVLTGAEDQTYAVDDPSYVFRTGGGCGGGEFGMTIMANDAASGATAFQLDAIVDADLTGGVTGTFDVEDISLAVITDGDLAGSRTYEGPGTIDITEHDTGGATDDPNARRMALTLEGSVAGTGPENDGSVDVSADIV